jgi:CheY-like chemotaxis protein
MLSESMENEFLKGKKILIVEDDQSSRLYLNKILERAGVVIMNAGDGQEAVDAAINNPDIDIILMDIQLPVLDGYSALIKIREVSNDMVVIAQTAYGLLGDKEKILNAGFDDYIIKPILSQNLIDKLVVNLKKK